jgi:hypothetical protein
VLQQELVGRLVLDAVDDREEEREKERQKEKHGGDIVVFQEGLRLPDRSESTADVYGRFLD